MTGPCARTPAGFEICQRQSSHAHGRAHVTASMVPPPSNAGGSGTSSNGVQFSHLCPATSRCRSGTRPIVRRGDCVRTLATRRTRRRSVVSWPVHTDRTTNSREHHDRRPGQDQHGAAQPCAGGGVERSHEPWRCAAGAAGACPRARRFPGGRDSGGQRPRAPVGLRARQHRLPRQRSREIGGDFAPGRLPRPARRGAGARGGDGGVAGAARQRGLSDAHWRRDRRRAGACATGAPERQCGDHHGSVRRTQPRARRAVVRAPPWLRRARARADQGCGDVRRTHPRTQTPARRAVGQPPGGRGRAARAPAQRLAGVAVGDGRRCRHRRAAGADAVAGDLARGGASANRRRGAARAGLAGRWLHPRSGRAAGRRGARRSTGDRAGGPGPQARTREMERRGRATGQAVPRGAEQGRRGADRDRALQAGTGAGAIRTGVAPARAHAVARAVRRRGAERRLGARPSARRSSADRN